jgi:hypothetical protein
VGMLGMVHEFLLSLRSVAHTAAGRCMPCEQSDSSQAANQMNSDLRSVHPCQCIPVPTLALLPGG